MLASVPTIRDIYGMSLRQAEVSTVRRQVRPRHLVLDVAAPNPWSKYIFLLMYFPSILYLLPRLNRCSPRLSVRTLQNVYCFISLSTAWIRSAGF